MTSYHSLGTTPCVLDALGPAQIILTLEVAYGSFIFSQLKIKRGNENTSPTPT